MRPLAGWTGSQLAHPTCNDDLMHRLEQRLRHVERHLSIDQPDKCRTMLVVMVPVYPSPTGPLVPERARIRLSTGREAVREPGESLEAFNQRVRFEVEQAASLEVLPPGRRHVVIGTALGTPENEELALEAAKHVGTDGTLTWKSA